MKTSPILSVVVALALLAALAGAPAVSACPGCKEAVAGADDDQGTPAQNISRQGAAYSYSVMFMLSVPALLLLGFGTAFYRLTRRQALSRPSNPPGG